MEKRRIRLFALITGIVSAIAFVVAFIIVRSQSFLTPRLIGSVLAFPSACLIAAIVALYVAEVWDEEDE
jgi:hypothetical protein